MFLFVALVAGLIAIGLTRLIFSSGRERGLSASQWLLAVFIWGMMLLTYYAYVRIF